MNYFSLAFGNIPRFGIDAPNGGVISKMLFTNACDPAYNRMWTHDCKLDFDVIFSCLCVFDLFFVNSQSRLFDRIPGPVEPGITRWNAAGLFALCI